MAEPANKREAQQRADRLRIFREELEGLERQGVVTLPAEQRSALVQHLDRTLDELARRFDVDTTASQRQFSWGMRIASTLGGLALCAAVYLFFYRYWGLLTTPAQVVVLLLAPVAALLATWFAASRDRTLYYPALLSIVTFACLVLDLTALGAIFNVTPSPGAFLVWGAFGITLAYTFGVRLPLVAGLVCSWIWAAASLAAWSGFPWMKVLERPESFLVPGLGMIAVSLLAPHRRHADFPGVWRMLGLLGVFLPVLALSEFGWLSWLPLRETRVEGLYQVVGFAAAGGTIWLGIRREWNVVVNLGALFFTVLLYARFVHWWWDWMPKYLFFLILGFFSIGLLVVFRRLRGRFGEVRAV